MITESLLIFLTTVMSLNQPTTTGQQVSSTQQSQTKSVSTPKNGTTTELLRGGWDRN